MCLINELLEPLTKKIVRRKTRQIMIFSWQIVLGVEITFLLNTYITFDLVRIYFYGHDYSVFWFDELNPRCWKTPRIIILKSKLEPSSCFVHRTCFDSVVLYYMWTIPFFVHWFRFWGLWWKVNMFIIMSQTNAKMFGLHFCHKFASG